MGETTLDRCSPEFFPGHNMERGTSPRRGAVFGGFGHDHRRSDLFTPPSPSHRHAVVPDHDNCGFGSCAYGFNSSNNKQTQGGILTQQTVLKSDFVYKHVEFTGQSIANRRKRYEKYTPIMWWEFKRDLIRMMTKIRFIKPEVDDKPPKTQKLVEAEKLRQELEELRQRVIRKENQDMCKRIQNIQSRPKSTFCHIKRKRDYRVRGDSFRSAGCCVRCICIGKDSSGSQVKFRPKCVQNAFWTWHIRCKKQYLTHLMAYYVCASRKRPPSKRPTYLVEMYKEVKLANPLSERKSIRIQQEMLESAMDVVLKASHRDVPTLAEDDGIILLTLEEQMMIPAAEDEESSDACSRGEQQDFSVMEEVSAAGGSDSQRIEIPVQEEIPAQETTDESEHLRDEKSPEADPGGMPELESLADDDSLAGNPEPEASTTDEPIDYSQVPIESPGIQSKDSDTESEGEPEVEILKYSIDKAKNAQKKQSPIDMSDVDILDYGHGEGCDSRDTDCHHGVKGESSDGDHGVESESTAEDLGEKDGSAEMPLKTDVHPSEDESPSAPEDHQSHEDVSKE